MPGIRSFVAIELPNEARNALADLQGELERQAPPRAVRWTRPQSIHLTLQFLGDVAPGKVEPITDALRLICVDESAFTCQLTGLGVFPNPRRPRVVWVGIAEPGGSLAALQKKISQALAPLGFEPEKRPFAPHLTIGRAARRAGRSELAEVGNLVTRSEIGEVGQVYVDHITLMKSDLKLSGAVYTALALVPFGTGGERG